MSTETAVSGYELCASGTARAVSKRRLGSLPISQALVACDVGEAVLSDGRRVLITWGRNLPPEYQNWYAHNGGHEGVWCGDQDGGVELIIGDTFGSTPITEWVWAGLRITAETGPGWIQVGGE